MLDLKTMYDEDSVRKFIKVHFDQRNFQVEKETKDFYLNPSPYSGAIDLDCINLNLKQRWIIEIKAENSDEYNYVKDFQAVLTQIIYRMQPPELFPDYTILYAIAVPGTKRYEARCRAMPPWPRQRLSIHWLLLQADRSAKLLCPPGCTCQIPWQDAHFATRNVSADEHIWACLE